MISPTYNEGAYSSEHSASGKTPGDVGPTVPCIICGASTCARGGMSCGAASEGTWKGRSRQDHSRGQHQVYNDLEIADEDNVQSTSDEVKTELTASTNEVVSKGSFGLPWYIGTQA